jgi:hypothetical protein
MSSLVFALSLGVVTTPSRAQIVELHEVQAENPRRLALFPAGRSERGWRETGSRYCARGKPEEHSDTPFYEHRAAQDPPQFVWFGASRVEPNWERTEQVIYLPATPQPQEVLLYEFYAEDPRRYALFPAGQSEPNWVRTGRIMRFLRCLGG